MKFLLLLMLSFVISSEWGTSFSVRTPNDETKPLDYELSIKLNDTNGKLRYLLKRDWERELGEKYIDDVANLHLSIIPYIFFGVDYVNKESKNIDYITYNVTADIDYFKAGVCWKKIDERYDPLLHLGINKKLKKDMIEYLVSVSAKSNIQDQNIINVKSEVKKWFTKKFNVFALYKHEYYNEQEDFQFKVGLGVKL
tara:strand:+ start:64 stop:654 length:591 start_codon:yes stop_codon:yes gene_type:complete